MISPKTKHELKKQAHHLHTVIIIGQHGLTPAVILETDLTLKVHELIKIKINNPDRKERAEISKALCTATQSEHLQLIGNRVVLYRANPKGAKPEVDKPKKARNIKN